MECDSAQRAGRSETTSPSVQYCSRLCNPHPGGGVGSRGCSPTRARAELFEGCSSLQKAEESAGFMSTTCSVLHGCAHLLAMQDVLGLEITSPQVATGQEGKLLLSSQMGNGTAVALPQPCLSARGSCASFPHVFCVTKTESSLGSRVGGWLLNPSCRKRLGTERSE